MGIATNDQPCWHLIDKDGSVYEGGDGQSHYESEQDAAEVADCLDGDDVPEYAPKQLDRPCVTVDCDVCGEGIDTDDGSIPHFDSEVFARSNVADYDWVISEGGRVLCEQCRPRETS